jgi:hypothetical protein
MNLLEEIREYFASVNWGARELKSLPKDFPGYVIKTSEGYGVAIPYSNGKIVSEKFANCKLHNNMIVIDGKEDMFLILSCNLNSLRYEFAAVCAQFAEPGENGSNRINLINNPTEWWQQWKTLLGNIASEKKPYNVIAEMLVLEHLMKEGKNVVWTAVNSGSHDIETDEECYEVKSTIKRYSATVTIAGQHQLQCTKRLYLFFCRMEKSVEGFSINDVKTNLVNAGYNEDTLEEQLNQLGYELGMSVRDEKYKVLEKRKYEVDQKFPQITPASFKGGKIPDNIIQITYTVDLDGLEYENW